MKSAFMAIGCSMLIAVTGCGGKSSQEEHNKNLTPVTAKGGLKPMTSGAAGDGADKGKNQSGAPKAVTPP